MKEKKTRNISRKHLIIRGIILLILGVGLLLFTIFK